VQVYEPAVFEHVPLVQMVGDSEHSLTSLQVPPVPGARYPALHAQVYEPGVFVQLARAAPQVEAVAHSFTSAHVPPLAGAVYPEAHAH
jgi:hypothetical protein